MRGDENLPGLATAAFSSASCERCKAARLATPCAPAMIPRLPRRSSSGMVTPLTPTGAPRSNAMSSDAGSPDFRGTAPRAEARAAGPLDAPGHGAAAPEAADRHGQRHVAPPRVVKLPVERHIPLARRRQHGHRRVERADG